LKVCIAEGGTGSLNAKTEIAVKNMSRMLYKKEL
jgi:hypothetical protein